jgi:flagellar L-ring protein precursor FlgH
MKFMFMRMATTMLAVVLAGVGSAAGQRTNSIFLRAAQDTQARSMRGAANATAANPVGGSYGANAFGQPAPINYPARVSLQNASWTTVSKPRQKNFGVHDLVTIVVHEVSKQKINTKADSEREYSISAQLTDWLRLTGGNLRPDLQSGGDPKIGFDFEKDLKSKAKLEREDMVTARVHAEVIDVLPNGNLVLEAYHRVVTDEEELTITLTGVCRSKDIGIDNSIISTQLAGLNLEKHHKGIARDTGKRGFISGFIDFILPF